MRQFGWMLLIALLLLGGCARGGQPQASTGGPVVQITAPSSGSRIPTGREVEIQSTATDPAGVERIELYVDGVLIRVDTAPAAGQSTFSVVQRWVPSQPGAVQVEVRAYNGQGQAGTPAGLTLEAEGAGLAPTATPTPRSLEVNPTPPPDVTAPTEPAEATEGIPGTVEAAAGLNVRQGPALDAERIDGVNPGTPVTAIARDATGEWAKVRYGSDNREGWIYAPYVTWDGDPSTLPVSSQ